MSKVIYLKTDVNTPFGKIGKISWNWKSLGREVEYLSGVKIGEGKLEYDDKKIIIPIRIIPADDPKDATIHPLQGEKMTFWIKQWLMEHLGKCDTCLRYVIIHEFTHLMPQFQFPLLWELRGFGKEMMYTVRDYIIDALIDRWNVLHNNYPYNAPIKFAHHMEQENIINFISKTREEFFENYIYLAKFVSHCETWKNNLYQHSHRFPHQLRDKYHMLLDTLSGVYTGPDFPIYELVRDIAELMFCPSKKDIIKREFKRRFRTLSDIGVILFNERNSNLRSSIQNLWNKRIINIIQLKNCLFGWNRTFNRIINISSDELGYINELLLEPSDTNEFFLSYFMTVDAKVKK